MAYYLLDHPNPNQGQTGRPRWQPINGMVGVHTTEGALDAIAPDSGAENVAAFIASRSDHGSYHEIVDSDSVVQMAPDDVMTWHTAAASLNGPAWGISAACRADQWSVNPATANYWWTVTTIATMGRRICAFWQRNGYDPLTPDVCRWLTGAQARGRFGPGLYHHGDAQPEDRSDAWALHPDRAVLDQMLLDAIRIAAGGAPDPGDDDMPSIDEYRTVLQEEISNYEGRFKATVGKEITAILDQLDPRRSPGVKVVPIRDLVEAQSAIEAGDATAIANVLADILAPEVARDVVARLGEKLTA